MDEWKGGDYFSFILVNILHHCMQKLFVTPTLVLLKKPSEKGSQSGLVPGGGNVGSEKR